MDRNMDHKNAMQRHLWEDFFLEKNILFVVVVVVVVVSLHY